MTKSISVALSVGGFSSLTGTLHNDNVLRDRIRTLFWATACNFTAFTPTVKLPDSVFHPFCEEFQLTCMKSIGMTAEVLDYFHTLCRLGLLVDDIWNNIYCGKKEVQTLLDNLRPIH